MQNFTKKILFSLPCFSALSLHASADIPLSEVFNDYSDKMIVRDAIFADIQEQQEEDSTNEDTVSCASVVDEFEQKLEALKSSTTPQHILSYNLTALNDITFQELTEKLLPLLPERRSCLIIDLSNNGLTTRSLPWILRLLDHISITWINIEGNPSLDKRRIADVCRKIVELTNDKTADHAEQKNKVQTYLRKIIFLPKYYVKTAKNRVKMYNQLAEKGYLPESWDDSHRQFYSTISNSPTFKLPTEEYSVFDRDECNISDLD